jgi:hypothetical protein
MLLAYVNYPNAHITTHTNPDCPQVRKRRKAYQRTVSVDLASLSEALTDFASGRYEFGSRQEANDMWLEVEVGDPRFEREIVGFIQRALGNRHVPFSRVEVEDHGCTPERGAG